MHSEGILAGELKHGPLALIDDAMPVIMIVTKDPVYSKCMNALQQVHRISLDNLTLTCKIRAISLVLFGLQYTTTVYLLFLKKIPIMFILIVSCYDYIISIEPLLYLKI